MAGSVSAMELNEHSILELQDVDTWTSVPDSASVPDETMIRQNDVEDQCETAEGENEMLLQDQSLEPKKNALVLERKIGLVHAVAIVVGSIIGSGIFISPSFVLKNCNSVGLTLLVWAFGGLISLLGGLCFCELATMIGKSGGIYVYLQFAYGNLVSFLYSWLSIWFVDPGFKALACLTFASYATEPFYILTHGSNSKGPPEWQIKLVGACFLCFITAINCVSSRWALKSAILLTASKVLAVTAIVVIGAVRLAQGHTQSFKEPFKGSVTSPGSIGHAFYSVMFAYSGWSELNFVTEEVSNPKKNFPRTILVSIPLVTLCYMLVNVAYFSVLNQAEYLSSETVVLTFGNKLNPVFGVIMPLVVALSCFGSLNTGMFCSGRILASFAMENQIPGLFSFVHRKSQSPIPALTFRAFLALLKLLPSDIETLINWLISVDWLIYCVVFGALIMLRFTKPNLPRGYKVNIFLPLLMVLISIYFASIPFITKPMDAVYGLVVIATGMPVYYLFIVKDCMPRAVTRFMSKITTCVQHFCNVEKPERDLTTVD